MWNRLIVGLVLLAAGCGGPTGPSDRTVRVTGRVLGFADGVGVSGVTVAFGNVTASTDAAGTCSAMVPGGQYQPTLDGQNAGTTYINTAGYRGDFLVHSGDCVSRYGIVADARTWRPISGATVSLVGKSTVTDRDGWYRIDLGCPAGGISGFNTTLIYVDHRDYNRYSQSVGRGVYRIARLDILVPPA